VLFVTGLELDAVSADLATFVPGRRLDDNAHVLMRFQGGARGVLAASQVAVGNLNNLSIKVYGSRAGLEWAGEEPDTLRVTPYGEPSRIFRRRSEKHPACRRRLPHARRPSRRLRQSLTRRGRTDFGRARRTYARNARDAHPKCAGRARGVAFIEAAVTSSKKDGTWTSVRFG
jgi:predicted dehydrogenase